VSDRWRGQDPREAPRRERSRRIGSPIPLTDDHKWSRHISPARGPGGRYSLMLLSSRSSSSTPKDRAASCRGGCAGDGEESAQRPPRRRLGRAANARPSIASDTTHYECPGSPADGVTNTATQRQICAGHPELRPYSRRVASTSVRVSSDAAGMLGVPGCPARPPLDERCSGALLARDIATSRCRADSISVPVVTGRV
jgi:hypothetical protein